MDIDYTVAALMFPAIPLMMTMYSNRFHTLKWTYSESYMIN